MIDILLFLGIFAAAVLIGVRLGMRIGRATGGADITRARLQRQHSVNEAADLAEGDETRWWL